MKKWPTNSAKGVVVYIRYDGWVGLIAACKHINMLKQVLEAGYIDPELLVLLNEEQKDLLFRKIREDQVRKWRIKEEELEKKEKNKTAKSKEQSKVNFMFGSDGNPWVWVMGEHHNDLPYEQLVQKREKENEAKEKQRLRKEAEELAKHETRDILLANKAVDSENQPVAQSDSVLECDSPVVRHKTVTLWQKAVDNRSVLLKRMSLAEQDAYERRRADELYENMLHSEAVHKKRAADVVMDIIKQWQKSEEKAKTFEQQRKASFIKAKKLAEKRGIEEEILESIPEEKKSEIKRRLSQRSLRKSQAPVPVQTSQQPPVGKLPANKLQMFRQTSFVQPGDTRPKSMYHAIRWFKEYEIPKGVGKDKDGCISLWFHGTIDKSTAESILMPKPPGMYLVRLSNKVWGYTVSVRTDERVKHYVVMATGGEYKFVGKNQPEFHHLTDLLYYYKVNPITWTGQEVLLLSCEQTSQQLSDINQLYENDEESSAM